MANAQFIPAWLAGKAQFIPAWADAAPPQLLAPISDISQGIWTPSSGDDLYSMLDEETASDTDYIISTSASSCEMRLAVGHTPSDTGDYILRYRLLAGNGSVTATLKQGSTTIASFGPHTLTGEAHDFAHTLTTAQVAAITDYADLRVVFESD